MKLMKFLTVSVLTAALALPAWALDLQTAKTQGLVGEKTDGYIGAVNPSGEVNALISAVNQQRKQAYVGISKENGQPLNVVETLAAKKLYDKLAGGEYYQAADGSWKKK